MDMAIVMMVAGGVIAIGGALKFYILPQIKKRRDKKRRSEAAKLGAKKKPGRPSKKQQAEAARSTESLMSLNGSGGHPEQGYADADLDRNARGRVN